MLLVNCRCDRFADVGADYQCPNLATQEDLLCDFCRTGACNMAWLDGRGHEHDEYTAGLGGRSVQARA